MLFDSRSQAVNVAARRVSTSTPMHQQGSLMPSLLNDVFCQCRTADTHPGVDPGGGGGHTEDPSPSSLSKPVTRQPAAASWQSDPAHSLQPCEICGGPEQEHRLKVLFQVLDVNGDGGICVNDLTIGLKKLGVHRTENELMVSGHNLSQAKTWCVYSTSLYCP